MIIFILESFKRTQNLRCYKSYTQVDPLVMIWWLHALLPWVVCTLHSRKRHSGDGSQRLSSVILSTNKIEYRCCNELLQWYALKIVALVSLCSDAKGSDLKPPLRSKSELQWHACIQSIIRSKYMYKSIVSTNLDTHLMVVTAEAPINATSIFAFYKWDRL